MKRPLFNYTRNFFLTLDMSRPAFKAQALYAADAVEADGTLPTKVRDLVPPLRAAIDPFNEKLVESLQPAPQLTDAAGNPVEFFADVRVQTDDFLRTLMRRVVGVRYAPGTDGYQRFLPQGLGEYNDADEKNYETYYERFVKALETEKKSFQYPPDDEATTTPAQDARTLLGRLQRATKSDSADSSRDERLRLDIKADWARVAIAAWRLWLALQDHYAAAPDYRERVYSYFDFSQLQSQGREKADDTPPASPPTPAPQA